MTPCTLTEHPTAGVLEALLADAARTREELGRRRATGPASTSAPGSPEFWAEFREVHLAVSPDTGRLLYFLARTSRARAVVEFGTSFGVSTIYLAAALRDNGGGRLVGTEFEATKAAATQRTLADAGLGDLVDIRIGDALHTLRTDLPAPIDFVLLDGTKTVYLQLLQMLEPSLSPQAVIVADNAARSPEYLDYVRNGHGYLSLPGPGDDIEITLRLASA